MQFKPLAAWSFFLPLLTEKDFELDSTLVVWYQRVRDFKTLKGLVETGACGGFDFDVSNSTPITLILSHFGDLILTRKSQCSSNPERAWFL